MRGLLRHRIVLTEDVFGKLISFNITLPPTLRKAFLYLQVWRPLLTFVKPSWPCRSRDLSWVPAVIIACTIHLEATGRELVTFLYVYSHVFLTSCSLFEYGHPVFKFLYCLHYIARAVRKYMSLAWWLKWSLFSMFFNPFSYEVGVTNLALMITTEMIEKPLPPIPLSFAYQRSASWHWTSEKL